MQYQINVSKNGKLQDYAINSSEGSVLEDTKKAYNLTNDEVVELLFTDRLVANGLEFKMEIVYEIGDDYWGD